MRMKHVSMYMSKGNRQMERDGAGVGGADESEPARPPKAEAIFQVAMREFLDQGYVAANMDRIATAAGVSKATVYSHFHDKEGLFTALSWHLVRKHWMVAAPPERAGMWDGEPRTVLRRHATAMLDTLVGDPELLPFIRMVIGESPRFPALARALVQNTDGADVDDLAHYLALRPELRVPDPGATARVVVGALFYFALSQEVLGGHEVAPMARERFIEAVVSLVFPGGEVGP